jgi:hypothetical protein
MASIFCSPCEDKEEVKDPKPNIKKLCPHGKDKYFCVPCEGKGICIHEKRKHRCKTCGGKDVCQHGKDVYYCGPCKGKGICEHDKLKTQCRLCKGSMFCEHDKRRNQCVLCDGSGLCQHKKRKTRCKICNPCEDKEEDKEEEVKDPKPRIKKLCPHGTDQYFCVPCEGKGMCIHGKRKARCKTCGGKDVCTHGKDVYYCVSCKGKGICEHDKVKAHCRLCKGSAICEHDKRRSECVLCIGSSTCEHKKNKAFCVECRGSQICEHDKRRKDCKKCAALGIGGSQICSHNKRISECIDCDGSQICIHKKYKSRCTECPIGELISKSICKICLSKRLSSKKRYALGICADCEPSAPERIEKIFGSMIIEHVGFEPNTMDQTLAVGENCKNLEKRRPDLVWLISNKVAVVVEIDENSHVEYETSCELSKISQQNEAIQRLHNCQNIPVYTIRVNPDTYDKGNITLIKRAKTVSEKVKEILQDKSHEPNGYQKVYYYCYHSNSQYLIDAQKKYCDVEII